MKIIIASLLLALPLSMCGQHLGNFKQSCEAQNGTYEKVQGSDYKCTLPDGKVLLSR